MIVNDIALGMQEHGLEAFAASVNASFMDQWKRLGFYDETEESWGEGVRAGVDEDLGG